MDTAVRTEASASPGLVWTGRILSGLIVLFLIGGSLFGIIKAAEFAPQFARTGYPMSLQIKIPIVCILCAILYAIPQTAVLGAILLAAYLGGATATHIRISEPFFFPILVAVLAWLGLYLRDPRLRELVPWRK
jgi:DoxX-like protein